MLEVWKAEGSLVDCVDVVRFLLDFQLQPFLT